MKIAMLHPGHAISTAWIYDGMVSALEDLGVEIHDIRLDRLISFSDSTLSGSEHSFEGEQGATKMMWAHHVGQQLAIVRVLETIISGAEVLVNICGKLWTPQNLGLLNLTPIPKVVMLTESPYEDDSQRRLLGAHDYATTNDKSSLDYLNAYAPTIYQPHAFDPGVFMPMDLQVKFDWSFIGTPFGNRKPILEALRSSPLAGYVFDQTDCEDENGKKVLSFVPQESACRVYNSTKVNLNIHRTEKYYGQGTYIQDAYSLGPRAFEIAGCRAFQLCDRSRPELAEIFGQSVATYGQPEEVPEAIAWWADPARDELRRDMATASYEIAQAHTYRDRARRLVNQLATWYNRPDWAEGLNDGD